MKSVTYLMTHYPQTGEYSTDYISTSDITKQDPVLGLDYNITQSETLS